jgi:sporulation protein YlmC with PRC-barrel domain
MPEAPMEEAPTPTLEAVAPAESITETEELTDAGGMTGTTGITGTASMTDTEELTDTEGLTDAVGMTETEEMTATEGITDQTTLTDTAAVTTTTAVTDSADMTETGGVSGASALTPTTGMTDTAEMTETAGIEAAPSQLMRASELQGFGVQNPEGEGLGSVQDFVLNLDTGEIVLVTVEYGGFLNIGDKVFPIPLSAFRIEQLREEIPSAAAPVGAPGPAITDTAAITDPMLAAPQPIVFGTQLILDIPEETFENAPGFADDFPVLTEPANVGEIETFYRDLGEEVIGRPIAETDLDALTGRAIKFSEIEGSNVQNPDGEGLGEIQDMLIDLQAGRVEYFILTFGGFLGIGENEYAIPVDAFEVIPTSADVEAGAPELVLDTTEEQLQEAPVFDELQLNAASWDLDVRDFWLPDAE